MKKIYKMFLTIIMIVFSCNILFAFELPEPINENIVATSSSIDLDIEKIDKSIFIDFFTELKPYLGKVITDKVIDNKKISTKEIIEIITQHPIKFLTSIYDYAVDSITNVFDFAEEGLKDTLK